MIITLTLGKPRMNSLLLFFSSTKEFWMHDKQYAAGGTWLTRRFLLHWFFWILLNVFSYNFLASLAGKLRHQGLEKSCERLQAVPWRAMSWHQAHGDPALGPTCKHCVVSVSFTQHMPVSQSLPQRWCTLTQPWLDFTFPHCQCICEHSLLWSQEGQCQLEHLTRETLAWRAKWLLLFIFRLIQSVLFFFWVIWLAGWMHVHGDVFVLTL